jgi:hypothetical protein
MGREGREGTHSVRITIGKSSSLISIASGSGGISWWTARRASAQRLVRVRQGVREVCFACVILVICVVLVMERRDG